MADIANNQKKIKRGRGRPPGSKNKKTLERERLAKLAQEQEGQDIQKSKTRKAEESPTSDDKDSEDELPDIEDMVAEKRTKGEETGDSEESEDSEDSDDESEDSEEAPAEEEETDKSCKKAKVRKNSDPESVKDNAIWTLKDYGYDDIQAEDWREYMDDPESAGPQDIFYEVSGTKRDVTPRISIYGDGTINVEIYADDDVMDRLQVPYEPTDMPEVVIGDLQNRIERYVASARKSKTKKAIYGEWDDDFPDLPKSQMESASPNRNGKIYINYDDVYAEIYWNHPSSGIYGVVIEPGSSGYSTFVEVPVYADELPREVYDSRFSLTKEGISASEVLDIIRTLDSYFDLRYQASAKKVRKMKNKKMNQSPARKSKVAKSIGLELAIRDAKEKSTEDLEIIYQFTEGDEEGESAYFRVFDNKNGMDYKLEIVGMFGEENLIYNLTYDYHSVARGSTLEEVLGKIISKSARKGRSIKSKRNNMKNMKARKTGIRKDESAKYDFIDNTIMPFFNSLTSTWTEIYHASEAVWGSDMWDQGKIKKVLDGIGNLQDDIADYVREIDDERYSQNYYASASARKSKKASEQPLTKSEGIKLAGHNGTFRVVKKNGPYSMLESEQFGPKAYNVILKGRALYADDVDGMRDSRAKVMDKARRN